MSKVRKMRGFFYHRVCVQSYIAWSETYAQSNVTTCLKPIDGTVSSDWPHALRNLCFITIKQGSQSGATHWHTPYQVQRRRSCFVRRILYTAGAEFLLHGEETV